MSQSTTPITDWYSVDEIGFHSCATVPSDICRTLERQRGELLEALKGLFEHCAMVHIHWGEGDNRKQADEAITRAKMAIAAAEGKGMESER